MKNNLIASFFLRITICTFLLMLFFGFGVFIYQTHHIETTLFLQGQKVIGNLIEGHQDPFAESDALLFENLLEKSNQILEDFSIVMLEIKDVNDQPVFNYNTPDSDTIRKQKKFSFEVFSSENRGKYAYMEFHDRVYLQILGPIHFNRKLLGYLKAVVEVNQVTVNRFRKERNLAMIMTVATILTVALVLYPLFYVSYQKLQQYGFDLLKSHLYSIVALGNAVAERDSDTDLHNYRVTYYSLWLAEHLALSPDAIRTLVKGAFLHDVGKIGIRDHILLKPSKLTEEEFAVMQTHVEIGVNIIKEIPWLADCRELIQFHHENYDGSGYPSGAAGEQIPLVARIFAVVDVFDALTSERPYKAAFSYKNAIEILNKQAYKFDPWILNGFLEISEALYHETSQMSKKLLENRLHKKTFRYFGI